VSFKEYKEYMSGWSKWLWGGLGWAVGGPIGGILGFALGALTDEAGKKFLPEEGGTTPGDFGAALLILCGAVMKSDNRLLKSELEFVKRFFMQQFGAEHAQERMLLFREILKQEYSVDEVCGQIRDNLDYQARLQLVHLLFGVSRADGEIHPEEIRTIERISELLEITLADFISIKAMFVKDKDAAYKILEVETTASNEEIKKAYRRLAVMHHPDKVLHLGPDFEKAAQEKFRMINEAYEQIKKERNIS
jgi:DnaJ like chaperone protein